MRTYQSKKVKIFIGIITLFISIGFTPIVLIVIGICLGPDTFKTIQLSDRFWLVTLIIFLILFGIVYKIIQMVYKLIWKDSTENLEE